MPYGLNASLGGFNSEATARGWISRESASWVKEYLGGLYVQVSRRRANLGFRATEEPLGG